MSKFITHLFYTSKESLPTIRFSTGEELQPLEKILSLAFDLSERFCTGWHDMTTGEDHACPENSRTDKKFSTCAACQKRTGFNPAFYHANKVSAQQEARNAEPHLLYLAYMGNGYSKVGITWGKRGTKRLLDQGARAGLVLDTLPTALIARQYEAKIVQLGDIHETTSTRAKLALLAHPFDKDSAEQQLLTTKQRIEDALSVKFPGTTVLFFDEFYSRSTVPSGEITQPTSSTISGTVTALVGDILLTTYDGRTLALPLRQFVGYPVEISDEIIPLELGPQQMQLF